MMYLHNNLAEKLEMPPVAKKEQKKITLKMILKAFLMKKLHISHAELNMLVEIIGGLGFITLLGLSIYLFYAIGYILMF